jgi:hypothetical protein
MTRRRTGSRVAVAVVVILLVSAVGFIIGRRSVAAGAPAAPTSTHPASSPSPVHLIVIGGIQMAETGIGLKDLPPGELPYPYITPVPPEAATMLDGAYLRIISVKQLGSVNTALPVMCLRCIPFRIDAGVSTLILYHGRYFLHDHLSDFRSVGFYEVNSHRIAFFDDPNCGTTRGVYRWTRSRSQLHLQVIHDTCPFDELRANDLTTLPWTAFDHCVFRVIGLWPGQLGCVNRTFRP